MDTFDRQKQSILLKLYKPDKSKKGTVDKPITKLIDFINNLEDYVTTSSCSGRILLFYENSNKKKNQCEWPYVTHEVSKFSEFYKSLKEFEKIYSSKLKEGTLMLKQESLILHVQCKDLESAKKILMIAQTNGFKHSGITALSKKIIVEISGSLRIENLIGIGGKILVEKDYLKEVLKKANERFKENKKRTDKFFKELKSEFR